MQEKVQKTIQELITPLIRALGQNHGKLLTLLRTFPPGADSLALRVLTIFTEDRRPSAQLVALVKSLISERDLDPRFLIPIIAEMDKVKFRVHTYHGCDIICNVVFPVLFYSPIFCAICLELCRS